MKVCTTYGTPSALKEGMNEVRMDVFGSVPEGADENTIITLCGRDASCVPEGFQGLVDVGDSDTYIPFRKIRSVHDFDGMPEDILSAMPEEDQEISKGAFRTDSFTDLHRMFGACRKMDRKHVILGMGEFGKITRIRQSLLGNEFTFGYEGTATAPGQLSSERLTQLGDGCEIIGLVGTGTEYGLARSLDDAMRHSGVNGICLEFGTDDLNDLAEVMREYGIRGVLFDRARSDVADILDSCSDEASENGADIIINDNGTLRGERSEGCRGNDFFRLCFGIDADCEVKGRPGRGHGVSFGAVSVINAIPSGIGATIGISLRTDAEYTEGIAGGVIVEGDPGADTTLAHYCVLYALGSIGLESVPEFTLRIRSEIPRSMGLKSSSSVCNAVISAVLDAHGVRREIVDIVRLGVDCARQCGVTITGAFDDACGCAYGGFVITDNNTDSIWLRDDVQDYDAVLCIPGHRTEKKDVPVNEYRKYRSDFLKLAGHAADDPLAAMTENGKLVGRIIGRDQYSDAAMRCGALAAGITGTGPATAVIAERGRGAEIAGMLRCDTIITTTRGCPEEFSASRASGIVAAPPSKSMTHRAILMAALSDGPCRIIDPLISDDTDVTADAVRSMGVSVETEDGVMTVVPGRLHAPSFVDAGNSGTTLRFMAAVSALFDSETAITGDASLCDRPMGPLLDALTSCGAVCRSYEGRAPVRIRGPIAGDSFEIDGSTSSQFVSALLIIAPMLGRPVDIRLKGRTVSSPYIELTVSMMREFGIAVETTKGGYRVMPGKYHAHDLTVTGDYSSAAYPLVAGALAGRVTVTGLDSDSPQGDRRISEILRAAGCSVTEENGTVTCASNGRPRAMDIDMSDIPDLFPIVAVLLSTADGRSRLYGASHLRNKESDRIETVTSMLRSLGADIEPTDDGCVIYGVKMLKGGYVDHRGDHRVKMAACIAAFVSDGPVLTESDGSYKVSYPEFADMLGRIRVR